jgi:hypothetical protein
MLFTCSCKLLDKHYQIATSLLCDSKNEEYVIANLVTL